MGRSYQRTRLSGGVALLDTTTAFYASTPNPPDSLYAG